MSLLSYLSNLFAPSPGEPTPHWVLPRAPDIPMPPVLPPKDRTPEPSCLAKGVAKAWIDDRANWVVTRSDASDEGRLVMLKHDALDIRISFLERQAARMVFNLECEVSGRIMIRYVRHLRMDYSHLCDAIKNNPYPELAMLQAAEKARCDQREAQDAARAAKLKAIEALGCAEGKV